ncbi:MAG TPA: hypothetical protein PLO44_01055 [Candidatus Paceibacterota bacterium]|nr:hypothetical protein [Candidatus Paceibacterota bacterium]
MIGDNNSSENIIKDTSSSIVSYDKENIFISLNSKTNKLITALYMVTDIMDKDEPLRNKLRSAGTDILSDMHVVSYRTDSNLISKNISRISEVVSFLELASTIRMISEMNYSILKKEFINLRDSLVKNNNPILIADFLNQNLYNTNQTEETELNSEARLAAGSQAGSSKENSFSTENKKEISNRQQVAQKNISTSHANSMRIGVQKGSTLMKAIKDIKDIKNIKTFEKSSMSNRVNHAPYEAKSFRSGFDNLKKERRDIIVKIIKDKKEATITDIKKAAYGSLAKCGEKTLQRELIAMVNDGVLKKAGEKRWSRYFL